EQHRKTRRGVGRRAAGRRAGPALRRRLLPGPQRSRLPWSRGLQRGRHHLPPAGLLGTHRSGRARGPRRHRLRHPAALQLPRHPHPQGDQAADRRRHLAAADPHRHRPPARPRRRRHHPGDADERRGLRLRVHLRRRGDRPAPRRPGRLRHRPRRCLARHRGHPRRAAGRAGRRRRGPVHVRRALPAPSRPRRQL
ncbi:MAG: transcriptional regulator, MerR family, partial [uncultured Friedmanniella sp.]